MSPEKPNHRSDPQSRPLVPRVPFALRVTFSYDRTQEDGGIRLVRVERVRATAPGIATAPPQPGQSGAWFEVHDHERNLLYYQPLHDPIPTTTEAFADESGKPFLSRLPNKKLRGEFFLLAPDLPNAVTLVLHISPVSRPPTPTPAEPAAAKRGRKPPESVPPELQPAKEQARITFDELRERVKERQ